MSRFLTRNYNIISHPSACPHSVLSGLWLLRSYFVYLSQGFRVAKGCAPLVRCLIKQGEEKLLAFSILQDVKILSILGFFQHDGKAIG